LAGVDSQATPDLLSVVGEERKVIGCVPSVVVSSVSVSVTSALRRVRTTSATDACQRTQLAAFTQLSASLAFNLLS